MKPTYFLGIDAAKHKMRATLSNRSEHVLFEKDLSVEATGLRQLLAAIKRQVNDPEQLLVLIEATGLLHLNWSAALTKAGYAVAVINPLIARRPYTLQNSIRDNKSDPIDARGLCTIGYSTIQYAMSPCIHRVHVNDAIAHASAAARSGLLRK